MFQQTQLARIFSNLLLKSSNDFVDHRIFSRNGLISSIVRRLSSMRSSRSAFSTLDMTVTTTNGESYPHLLRSIKVVASLQK